MRLSELAPKLEGNILTFDCPSCTSNLPTTDNFYDGREHKIRVPLKPGEPNQNGAIWNVTGEYPNLTLTPSINAGCWHGFITNGEIITC
jgi:uncharacterized protein DUF6527